MEKEHIFGDGPTTNGSNGWMIPLVVVALKSRQTKKIDIQWEGARPLILIFPHKWSAREAGLIEKVHLVLIDKNTCSFHYGIDLVAGKAGELLTTRHLKFI